MGSRPAPPPPPTIVMPSQTAPTMYRTLIPQESYQDVRDYGRRLQEQIQDLEEAREQETGTAAERGARQAALRAQEAAAYQASLPGQFRDPGLLAVNTNAEGFPVSSGSGVLPSTPSAGERAALQSAASNVAQANEALRRARQRINTPDPSRMRRPYDPEYARRSGDVFRMEDPEEDD